MNLPCLGNEALYDTALYDDATPTDRQQAIHQAAVLCAGCPTPCERQITHADLPATPECPRPSYGGYLAHKKRSEDACRGCKEAKRVYDRERYARNPRKARAPQRAYEARQRAAAGKRVAV